MHKSLIASSAIACCLLSSSLCAAGLYASLTGGAQLPANYATNPTNPNSPFKDGYNFGGALGFQFALFRAEISYYYLNSALTPAAASNKKVDAHFHTIMFNAYYDFLPLPKLDVYLGAGLGIVDTQLSKAISGSMTGSDFGAQLIAGATFDLTSSFSVGVEYHLITNVQSSGSDNWDGSNNSAVGYHNLLNAVLLYHFSFT